VLHDLMDPFIRTWADITSGRHAPFAFRFIVQPLVAAFFAYRAGRQDALAGRPPYFWRFVTDPGQRRALALEAWKHVGKVLVVALVIDAVYQVIVLRWIYLGEALMVAMVLAVLPYALLRGPVNRLLRSGRRP
jgi:hypothetical protein